MSIESLLDILYFISFSLLAVYSFLVRKEHDLKYIHYLMLLVVVSEYLFLVLKTKEFYHIAEYVYYFNTPLDFVFTLLYFKFASSFLYVKKSTNYLIIIFLIFFGIVITLDQRNAYIAFNAFSDISILSISLLALLNIEPNKDRSITTIPLFWISSGFIFYIVISLSVSVLRQQLMSLDSKTIDILWTVLLKLSNFIAFTCFAIGIRCRLAMKKM